MIRWDFDELLATFLVIAEKFIYFSSGRERSKDKKVMGKLRARNLCVADKNFIKLKENYRGFLFIPHNNDMFAKCKVPNLFPGSWLVLHTLLSNKCH